MTHITWLIPDLKQALQACDTPVLGKNTTDFLKATVLKHDRDPDLSTALYHHFGGEGVLPRATLLALYYDLPPANAWVLCEPVECIESQKEVICLGNAHLTITQAEAQAHVTRFNTYWEGTGRIMYAITPTQWLLALPEAVPHVSVPLRQVLNQSLPKRMPRLFLEAQLLMQGKPLNALWISGEGALPSLDKNPRTHVMTNQPEAIALTKSVMGKIIPFCHSFDDFWKHYGKSRDEWIIALSSDSMNAVSEEAYLDMLDNRWLKTYLMHATIDSHANQTTDATNSTSHG